MSLSRPSEGPQEGLVRVLIGRYGATQSVIPEQASISYLAVRLKDNER